MNTPPKLTVEFSSRVHVVSSLRALRSIRSYYAADLLLLQERVMQRGTDVVAQSAILALATELDLLDEAIRAHWATLGLSAADDPEEMLGIRKSAPSKETPP